MNIPAFLGWFAAALGSFLLANAGIGTLIEPTLNAPLMLLSILFSLVGVFSLGRWIFN